MSIQLPSWRADLFHLPKTRLLAVVWFGWLALASPASAVVYVNKNAAAGGNGTSWALAYRTLETAISQSGTSKEFWVAKGTYTPTATLNPQSGSKFYGGFSGTETQLSQRSVTANPTIIDSQYVLKHAFFVAITATSVRIDGLSIKNGRGLSGTGWDVFGAGIFVDQTHTIIANCTFENNSSGDSGGAVMINRTSSEIRDCNFYDNSAELGGGICAYDADVLVTGCYFQDNTGPAGIARGGAIWLYKQSPTIQNSTFSGNSAEIAGAVDMSYCVGALVEDCLFANNVSASAGGAVSLTYSTGTVRDSTFDGNTAGDNAGGIWTYASPVTVQECTFFENHAYGGGGIQLDYDSGALARVERCIFIGNTATYGGGAISSYAQDFVAENCVFAKNSTQFGGAIITHAGLTADFNANFAVTLRNCTVYGNHATEYGGGMCNSYAPMIYIYNTIFWGNSADALVWDPGQGQSVATKDIFNSGSSSMTTRYCDIETWTWEHGSDSESHTGTFASDPKFKDPNGPDNVYATLDDDLRLQSSSPCLDRADGNNDVSTDINFNARVDLVGVSNQGTGSPNYGDIGAYEEAPTAATPTCSPNGGTFSSPVWVSMSSATSGATIRYTTDGSTPTTSSPAGTSVQIKYTATLKAKAFAAGHQSSAVKSATFTIRDDDDDGLPNWVETDTGTFTDEEDTGTDPDDADTDNDGFNDGTEVNKGTDPHDPDDYPTDNVNDFDGDAAADIAVYDVATGDWYIQESQAKAFRFQNWGWADAVPVTGDYDGDGKTDIAVYYGEEGDWYIQQSGTGQLFLQNWGWSEAVAVPADYDGDGKTDIAVYYATTGYWYIRQSQSGQLRQQQWGWSAAVATPGDFDGDGKADIAVYYAETGTWYIQESGTGALRTQQWGWSATVAVPGDYDGDGKSDIAVYYATTGDWYIQKSTDGKLRKQQWGWSAADAVPADYDRDGKCDITVYYATTGDWYVQKSSTMQLLLQNWGWSGATPVSPQYQINEAF